MLEIYKASAGSGKTFALTLEYFKIIFANPSEYRRILAVTFTNKATEEMKSRIIHELDHLAEGRQSAYGPLLEKALETDGQTIRNRAALLRSMLLHDYGRLSVTTIDRFFQRVLKAFTRELGLFPGYNVELDSDFVLEKAVEGVLQKVSRESGLKEWIAGLMERDVEQGKSWGIRSKVSDLGAELFRENYMLFDNGTLDKFKNRELLEKYREFLDEVVGGYEKSQRSRALHALEVIREGGLQLADFKSGSRGCASYFFKIAEGNFDPPSATVRKGASDETAWVAGTSRRKADIGGVRPELMRCLQEILEHFDSGYAAYLSGRQISANLYQLGILNDLCQEVRSYCEEKGVMLLSDTTRLLNLLIEGNDTSFLYEKCGNYYSHVMIDEFQDTSGMQWNNFRPLVVNSLSEGGHSLIVGDVKQSIYRWRNGDWGLLAEGVEKELKALGTENVWLQDNWRSAREIVEFNNVFFAGAARQLATLYAAGREEEDGGPETIAGAYRNLEQHPRSSRHGYVEVSFLQEKGEGADETIMENVVAIIRDIIGRGGRQEDIVILVRNGKEGAFVADYLMEYNRKAGQPVSFVSNDSLFIASSPCVGFLVSLLRYYAEPFDMVNKAGLLSFYRSVVQGFKDYDRIFRAQEDDGFFQRVDACFTAGTDGRSTPSLYEAVEVLIARLELGRMEEEIPYLIAFQDVIYDYENSHSSSIPLFLEWWEKEKDKRVLSTSEDVDAVRILTIHKSKGLEFGYVILPFCSWELDAVRPVRRIWCSCDEPGFKALDAVPLNYSSKLAGTIFREDYYREHLKSYIDNLNLLYVALTRPKRELYVLPYLPGRTRDGSVRMSDMGAFIWSVLEAMGAGPGNGEGFRSGEKTESREEREAGEAALGLEEYPVCPPGGRISVKYRYRDFTALEEDGQTAIDKGRLFHEIFRSIRYRKDVGPAVRQAVLEGLVPLESADTYREEIGACLGQPQVGQWFDEDWEVINENDILFPGGKKVRPDRVIVRDGRAVVIDYKFGRKEEKSYLRQVGFYCSTLKKMGYAPVDGYIWYVNLEKVVKV